MSIPASSAAAASSSVVTRSIVRWPLPFRARRSATVGFFRMLTPQRVTKMLWNSSR